MVERIDFDIVNLYPAQPMDACSHNFQLNSGRRTPTHIHQWECRSNDQQLDWNPYSKNACKFYIGGDVATGAACSLIPERNFRGNIDEVRLYNYELSAAEVQADMTLGRNCSGTYDHIRIEHDGVASVCTPETVTIKACLNSSCTSLYTGSVTVQLTPTGWTGGDTFNFSGGVTTRSLGIGTAGTATLGVASASPLAANAAKCYNGSTQSCSMTYTAASCNFDAVEVGANPKTRIFTKLAATAFDVDILALSGSSVNTAINSAVKRGLGGCLVDELPHWCRVDDSAERDFGQWSKIGDF